MLKQLLIILLVFIEASAVADPASLAWWLLPDSTEGLPHEIEEDDSGNWTELWVRGRSSESATPSVVMEQMPGLRWMGSNPDKTGRPTKVILVLNEKKVIEFAGEQSRFGMIEGSQIKWSDNSVQSIVEQRKRRGRRGRKRSKRISFGKVALPTLTREKALSEWTVESIGSFLQKIPNATTKGFTTRDLSTLAQLTDSSGSVLGFRYSDRCSLDEKAKVEDALAKLEPRLTCWLAQNPDLSHRLLAILLQKPVINCRAEQPMKPDSCGMASVPYDGSFFVTTPTVNLPLQRCGGELEQTLLHEISHLAGLREIPAELEKVSDQAYGCESFGASLNFESVDEEFYNDLQVETRMYLFKKIRDEATKWQWLDGEKSFAMGAICARMGDKYCARRYFQQATENRIEGMVLLPGGTDSVTWSSLTQFYLYDSVSEDLQRMHELVRYLQRDPQGTLLRRLETGTHRLHERYVARQALEAVKTNKGICNSETDEHILCEDLAALVKTPWFLNP